MARMLPREAELVPEWTGLPRGWSVKRFERPNGLDTALYKNIPFIYYLPALVVWRVAISCIAALLHNSKHATLIVLWHIPWLQFTSVSRYVVAETHGKKFQLCSLGFPGPRYYVCSKHGKHTWHIPDIDLWFIINNSHNVPGVYVLYVNLTDCGMNVLNCCSINDVSIRPIICLCQHQLITIPSDKHLAAN